MRQQLLLDKYAVELNYVKGETNLVADELSRLPTNLNVDEKLSEIPIQNKTRNKKRKTIITEKFLRIKFPAQLTLLVFYNIRRR